MAAFLARALGLSAPSEKGSSRLGTEVINLSRNVVIGGTPGGRSHVLIHSTVPQTIHFVEISHVGPRVAGPDHSLGVVGRYGLHFHHCMNGSVGTSAVGVVVKACGSHAFVPHDSFGITLDRCISYDSIDDAYWWDNSSSASGLSILGCVASYVKSIPSYRGYRLTGFELAAGQNVTMRDSVAVGVQGNTSASGIAWPEMQVEEGVWAFDNCVSHNNKVSGVFVWQNTGRRHLVKNLTCYRNGSFGIDHGAYINRYVYEDVVLLENPVGLNQAASSASGDPLTFRRVVVSGPVGVRLAHHALAVESTSRTLYIDCSITSDKPVVVDEVGGGVSNSGHYDFIDCSLSESDFTIESSVSGSSIRISQGGSTTEILP